MYVRMRLFVLLTAAPSCIVYLAGVRSNNSLLAANEKRQSAFVYFRYVINRVLSRIGWIFAVNYLHLGSVIMDSTMEDEDDFMLIDELIAVTKNVELEHGICLNIIMT